LLGEAATVYPTALPAETSATPALIQHVVRRGDTLSSLARQYATTTAEIQALNTSLADPNYLTPGTTLSIRPNTAPAARTHRVTRGETLSSIARRYGVSVSALSQANGLNDPNQLYAGQLLIIP
jgi:LysM repeat protein